MASEYSVQKAYYHPPPQGAFIGDNTCLQFYIIAENIKNSHITMGEFICSIPNIEHGDSSIETGFIAHCPGLRTATRNLFAL